MCFEFADTDETVEAIDSNMLACSNSYLAVDRRDASVCSLVSTQKLADVALARMACMNTTSSSAACCMLRLVLVRI